MQKIIGKYTSATVFSDDIENYAEAQVKMICDNSAVLGSELSIMPDVHPGKIGPVGLTMIIKDRVMPGLIGNDIGCGVSYMKIKGTNIEFQKLDKLIRERIPSGEMIRKEPHFYSDDFDFNDLKCRKYINEQKAKRSLGSLGGGNHFIEVDKDEIGDLYVFVHTGSRHLGNEVFEYYMKKGQKDLKQKGIYVMMKIVRTMMCITMKVYMA